MLRTAGTTSVIRAEEPRSAEDARRASLTARAASAAARYPRGLHAQCVAAIRNLRPFAKTIVMPAGFARAGAPSIDVIWARHIASVADECAESACFRDDRVSSL